MDSSSGAVLDCGDVPGRVDCPPGSYCHVTREFARCCPIDVEEENEEDEKSTSRVQFFRDSIWLACRRVVFEIEAGVWLYSFG